MAGRLAPGDRANGASPDVNATLAIWAAWSWRVLAVAAAIALAAFVFWTLRAFAIPLFLAILLATQLLPASRWLARRGLPRWLAVLAVIVALVAGLGFLTILIIGSFVGQLDEIGALVSQAADQVADWLRSNDGPLALGNSKVSGAVDQAGPALASAAQALFGGVLGGVSLLAELVAGSVLAFAFLIYLLGDGENVGEWLVGRFADAHQQRARQILGRGWRTLGGYVRGVTTVALFDAVLIGAGLVGLGVPVAGSLIALVFLAAFVPIAGAWISGVIVVAVALAGNGVATAVIVLVIVLAVQEIESLVLDPIVYRRSVNLHPLVTLAAVTAGGIVAGIIGALIAVPFVALAWALIDEHDRVRRGDDAAAA